MFHRDRQERELERELHGFVRLLIEEKIAAGLPPERARREALIEAGGVEQVKEAVRDVRRGAWIETVLRDVRSALRTLRASPAFSGAVILTLAIGIGANTAIFSAVDGVLFKPLPFAGADRVVTLFQSDRLHGTDRADVAPGNFADWRARNRTFAAIAAAEPFGLVYATPDGPERVGNWNVTEDFFTVLNARPVLGRLLEPHDFRAGSPGVVVLTFDSWQHRFGADPGVVGRILTVGGAPVEVVGVLPRDFSYLGTLKRYEMFSPKVLDATEVVLRNSGWYHVVGRLKPGVTLAQAAADMHRIAAQLEQEHPNTNSGSSITVVPLRDGIVGTSERLLFLLLGAVAFVLLIACANVTNLTLARTARRSREFAVRIALGASPRRIAQHVLTESFVIALAGGLAGTALAHWCVGAIRRLSPATLPRVDEIHVDTRALAFTMAIVLLTTFVVGLLPALRAAGAGGDPHAVRVSGGRSAGGPMHRRLRRVLVAGEVALAVVLLVGAGLLMRSFIAVNDVQKGYRTDHVLSSVIFIWQWDSTRAQMAGFADRLTTRLARIPGVDAAGVTTSLPLDRAIGADRSEISVDRPVARAGEKPTVHVTSLTPGAFDALRMIRRRGRWFTAHDDTSSVPVAIVSEGFARRYWPSADPIGRHLTIGFYGAPVVREVVGVAADVRQSALDAPPEPTVYLPYAQAPAGGLTLVLRTRQGSDPRTSIREMRRAVAELNPHVPVTSIATLDDIMSDSLKARRFTLLLFACFAGAALLLAGIGVYGVISHATAERTREFGVRIALGAQRTDILQMVVGQGLASTGIGLVAGITGATLLTRVLRGMLFGVSSFDALTFAGVAVLMFLIALVACYVPARRATKAHPASALRLG